MRANIKDYLHLHFLVILWGFTAILGLLISVPAMELVFYRTLLASLGLFLVIRVRHLPLFISPKYTLQFLGTGGLIAMHWILFFGSARVSTASVCLAGIATTSFWTSLIEPLTNRRKVQLLDVVFGLVVIAGLYLIFHFEISHALGLTMALVSALLAAIFTVINSRLTHKHNHHTISFYEMTGAWLFTIIFLIIYALLTPTEPAMQTMPIPMDWLYLALLAFACTVYPFTASIELMKRISAFLVTLSVNMEPVYGILLAFIIFGDKERMNTGFYLGTLVILFSVILYPVIRSWINRRQLKNKKSTIPLTR